MWFFYSLWGSISLVLLNTMSKLLPLGCLNAIPMVILSILTTILFWVAFQTGNGFGRVWFIQTAMVALGFFASNHFIIGESISWPNLIGILTIIFGTVLLRI